MAGAVTGKPSKTLEQSLAIQREIGDRAGEAETSWNLGLEYERRGDLARGYRYWKAR